MTTCKLPVGLQGRGLESHPPWQAGGRTGAKGQCYGLWDSNETFPEEGSHQDSVLPSGTGRDPRLLW